jgi:acyl transferase domain-containing protein/acyl-CoA synthetase (AMP-forming)/AMP-acid ligase II/acyl carrier protein
MMQQGADKRRWADWRTICDLLRWRATEDPARRAYTFLTDDDETGEAVLTYTELDRRARAIAARLEQLTPAGERAVLLYGDGLEFIAGFFGCLYGGLVAVPTFPPHPARLERTLPRLRGIAADAGATVVLTTRSVLAMRELFLEHTPELGELTWIATDGDPDVPGEPGGSGENVRGLRRSRAELALLQYTSGSTGSPKGVRVTHDNILHNVEMIRTAFGMSADKVVMSWLPLFHDMGLIGHVLGSLYWGSHCVLMSPLAFLQRPVRWPRAIARYRAAGSGGPSFAYDLCARKIPRDQIAGLDLSCWTVAFCGAEPVHHEALARFAQLFGDTGFRRHAFVPCYGLAEATLLVSAGSPVPGLSLCAVDGKALERHEVEGTRERARSDRTIVGCGQFQRGMKVLIVDPGSRIPCRSNRVGEIWISGPSVADGYWNRPVETTETFGACLDTEEGPFLRSGDLGFIRGGELFVTGRLKDLIVVRGRNHHPQDLERTAQASHSALRPGCGAAFSIDAGGEEQVVIVNEATLSDGLEPGGIIEAVRHAIAAAHDLHVHAVVLIAPRTIPKTSSGKLQRHACRDALRQGRLEVLAEWREGGTAAAHPAVAPRPSSDHGAREIECWLVAALATLLHLEPAEIDPGAPFSAYGLDSVQAVNLAGDLEQWLGLAVPATAVWEHPSIRGLAAHLAGDVALEVKSPQSQAQAAAVAAEPIAIIGMACRFPGDASSLDAYWELLRSGGDAISAVPRDRWDLDALYDPDPAAPGKMTTRWGGFLDHIDRFDRTAFGISAREAKAMDPQQRILLEVACEALEDAGLPADALAGSSMGVFVGISNIDYAMTGSEHFVVPEPYMAIGAAHSIAAGRLSYFFDLRGPSLAVDTACSSSLVAAYFACQSLRSGQCTTALVGGVNVILDPKVSVAFSQGGFLSPDGRCKTFDASANGYARGEGCGVVVLKPLARAVADGDSIWAVIRGAALNQDGRSAGITAPNGLAQQAVIRAALRDGGVEPSEVSYVEAHGTGTPLGDPIEMEALAHVLGRPDGKAPTCLVGSAKTNIGHLEAAAGIAGLIKVALCLAWEAIAPHLHLRELNPHISLDGTRFEIPTTLRPWPSGPRPRFAGLSSFGFSGTNAHLVLEEAPRTPAGRPDVAAAAGDGPPDPAAAYLLPISAQSAQGLTAMVQKYADFLRAAPGESLGDICYSASVRRTHHGHRTWVVGRTGSELIEQLAAHSSARESGGSGSRISTRRQKCAFIFSGQGSQWAGMGRELLRTEAVFREAMGRCDAAFRVLADVSVLDEIGADDAQSRLDRTAIAQPAIFSLQVALAALWRSWGVEPDTVVGHSVGEVAAAHVAGILALDDAARVVFHRARLMERSAGCGRMLAVGLRDEAARRVVQAHADQVAIAAINGSRSTVLSGDKATLETLRHQLEDEGVFARWLTVNYAFHSPQMRVHAAELVDALCGLQGWAAAIPMVSTVTAEPCAGPALDAAYWGRNVQEPVRFAEAIERLAEDGHAVFVEIGGHPVLAHAVQELMEERGQPAVVVASLRREKHERPTLLASLGALYAAGHPVDWWRLYPNGGRSVRLPTTAWQRESYWFEAGRPPAGATGGEHPLLGGHLASSVERGTHYWEREFSTEVLPYLGDHRVGEAVLLPAAAYAEMAVAAAAQVWDQRGGVLVQLVFEKVLVLPASGGVRVQTHLTTNGRDEAAIQILAARGDTDGASESWVRHATAVLTVVDGDGTPQPAEHATPAAIKERCPEPVDGATHYQLLMANGLAYGPRFQTVEQLWRGHGEAIGLLRSEDGGAHMGGSYRLHPTLLDGAFQVVAGCTPRSDTKVSIDDVYLPVGVDRFRVNDCSLRPRWSHAVLREADGAALVADVYLLTDEGAVAAAAEGLRLQRFGMGRQADGTAWLYGVEWRPAEAPAEVTGTLGTGTWMLFSAGDDLETAVRTQLEARGESCIVARPGDRYERRGEQGYTLDATDPSQFRQLLREALANGHPACAGFVHLWSVGADLGQSDAASALAEARRACADSVLHLVQAIVQTEWREGCPRLVLVTRGAQAVGVDEVAVAQAPLLGLGKVIALEHPELKCMRIDLSPAATPSDAAAALCRELWTEGVEEEIALRADGRCVPRLVHAAPENGKREPTAGGDAPAGDRAFRLEAGSSGVLDHVQLRAARRVAPGPGEVEIAVRAAGLNFKDVLLALGLVPNPTDGPVPLGGECAGVVTDVGDRVDGLRPGDPVVAVAPWSFGRFVVTPADYVVRKSERLSFEEAASLPLVFMTAWHALHEAARLRAGERVLIHAGAGGVGLAAVQIAQRAGAEVFATAGTPEKRAYLSSLGIPHVMDSRSLAFANAVLEYTGGRGVDVVLNSLSGQVIEKNLEILAPYGRFVEIGVRDIYENHRVGLRPFHKNLTYVAVDLTRMALERRSAFSSLLREVLRRFDTGELRPPRRTTFPFTAAAEAFRYVAQAKHIGKVVLTLENAENVPIAPARPSGSIRGDATYLITGGLGGLGLSVARWLVERGAQHLLLVGRRSASPDAARVLEGLREAGAEVVVAAADVACEAELAAALAARGGRPLGGVVHAAGVLDDSVLLQLDATKLASVMAPKVQGAWNLHALTAKEPLDFFVLFSSAASLLGSPGQGNYAAANAFLDALAHYRRARGLPALSINWGPWAEVGMAAAQANRGERLATSGMCSLDPARATALLERLITTDIPQVGVMALDLPRWFQFFPAAAHWPFLAELARGQASTAGSARGETRLRAELLAVAPGRRLALLEGHLRQQIAAVLQINPAEIDPRGSLGDAGFDSLMAVELKNRLEASTGVTLSATLMFNYPTLERLGPKLAQMMRIDVETPDTIGNPDAGSGATTAEIKEIAQLSDREARDLLVAELAGLAGGA